MTERDLTIIAALALALNRYIIIYYKGKYTILLLYLSKFMLYCITETLFLLLILILIPVLSLLSECSMSFIKKLSLIISRV